MFDSPLSKYSYKGNFTFDFGKSFKEACNAPVDQSGVYLIFKIVDNEEILLYIGSSGQRGKDGSIKHRNGGLKDRLINGYHPNRFGEARRIKRHIAIPKQMVTEGIDIIKIYWWVTHDENCQDLPSEIEGQLCNSYCSDYGKKPAWHKQ